MANKKFQFSSKEVKMVAAAGKHAKCWGYDPAFSMGESGGQVKQANQVNAGDIILPSQRESLGEANLPPRYRQSP